MPDLELTFDTDDIYLAAYLAVCGCVLEKRKKIGQKVIFVFSNPAGSIKDLREAYYSGKARVDPHLYSHGVQSYKKLCFDSD